MLLCQNTTTHTSVTQTVSLACDPRLIVTGNGHSVGASRQHCESRVRVSTTQGPPRSGLQTHTLAVAMALTSQPRKLLDPWLLAICSDTADSGPLVQEGFPYASNTCILTTCAHRFHPKRLMQGCMCCHAERCPARYCPCCVRHARLVGLGHRGLTSAARAPL